MAAHRGAVSPTAQVVVCLSSLCVGSGSRVCPVRAVEIALGAQVSKRFSRMSRTRCSTSSAACLRFSYSFCPRLRIVDAVRRLPRPATFMRLLKSLDLDTDRVIGLYPDI